LAFSRFKRDCLNGERPYFVKEETPVPIPNTEVKLFSADGTAWVTEWESRTLPGFFMPKKGTGAGGSGESGTDGCHPFYFNNLKLSDSFFIIFPED